MKKSTKIVSLAMMVIMLLCVGVVSYAAAKEAPATYTYSITANEEQLKLMNELRKENPDITKYEMYQIVFPEELKVLLRSGIKASELNVRAFKSQESLSADNSAAADTCTGTCKGSRSTGYVDATATSTSTKILGWISADVELLEEQPFSGTWEMVGYASNVAYDAKTVSATASRTTGYILRTHKGEGFHCSNEGDFVFSYSGAF